jgi:hypothetical protein
VSELTRREFLAGCAATSLLAAEKPLYAYAGESFSTTSPEAPFVLGLLLTSEPEKHIAAIRAIKQRVPYGRQLKYHGTDRLRISQARELIHYFTHDAELRFVGHVVNLSSPIKGKKFYELRVSQYPALVREGQLPRETILRLRRFPRASKDKRRPFHFDPDQEFRARAEPLLSQHLVARAEPVSQRAGDGLCEVANLLTGSLFHDAALTMLPSSIGVGPPIVTRLRRLLNVKVLTAPAGSKWQPRVSAAG